MIKNIVFDLDNVVFKGKHITAFEKFNITKEQENVIENALFQSKNWKNVDLGYLTFEQIYEKECNKIPLEMQDLAKEILYNLPSQREFDNEMIEIIKKLRSKGYKIFILSNFNIPTYEYLKTTILNKYIDGYMISAFVHYLKPNKKIYECLFNEFNLVPEECFFIDDRESNIKAGKNLGMPGYVLHQRKDRITKLKEEFKKYQIDI